MLSGNWLKIVLRPLPLSQQPGRYPADQAIGGKTLGNNGPGGYHAAFADGDPTEYGHLATDPAILSNGDGLALHTLQADRDVRIVEAVIFGMAAKMLPDDTVVTNGQATRATQIRKLTNAHPIANVNEPPRVVEGSRDDQPAERTNAHLVTQPNPIGGNG